MAQLTERDRGLLQNKIDDLTTSNQRLQDGITSDTREVNNLTLLDIASKKFLDEQHLQIYELEEERRLLTGKTIIGPVQTSAFTVTTTELNVTLTINDGRCTVKKDDIVIVDVPIVTSRAYNVSKAVGPDFEIWTRDRHGSTTSERNVPSSYVIHASNNKITVKIDGVTKEIQVFDTTILEAQDGQVTAAPDVLAAQISLAMTTSGFTDAVCIYNTNILTFTIASGTGGTSSTAEVIVSTDPNSLSKKMKFTNSQVKVTGRYANNNLKIKIDGVQKDITLINDVRKTVTSSLGQALDDYSADWRTTFTGPLFPATANNGSKIAVMIQSKLREIGTGGYTNAECLYYSDSNKFVIYSGTFGATSSVEVLAASNVNTDLRAIIGMDQPSDVKNKETSYVTLTRLFNHLNSKTCVVCTSLSSGSTNCYSLLTINDADISNKVLTLQITPEYDSAHLAQPRLYGGRLVVGNSNNDIDLKEGATVRHKTITNGTYSESELAIAIQDALNSGTHTQTYIVQYKNSKFIITADASMQFLFNTGDNIATAITTYIGFSNTADLTNTAFTSNTVSFAGADFFSMAQIPQLVPMSHFSNQPPYYLNAITVVVESSAANSELYHLNLETGSGALQILKNQAAIYNESYLLHWQMMAVNELAAVNVYIAQISSMIALYSAISTTDSNYLNMVAALNSANNNKTSLTTYGTGRQIVNYRAGSQVFTPVEASNSSLVISFANPNDDRLYNRPAVEFSYADTKYIPMILTFVYSNSVTCYLCEQIGFSIKSNLVTYLGNAVTDVQITITSTQISSTVYWSTGSAVDINHLFSSYPNIKALVDAMVILHPSYTFAFVSELWSKYSEEFLLTTLPLTITIGSGSPQNFTWAMVSGYTVSDSSPTTSVVIGDTLTLSINGEAAKTITLPIQASTGNDVAALLQTLIRSLNADVYQNQPAYTNFVCQYTSGQYFLYSGTAGTGSTVSVTGGTLKTTLKLNTAVTGTGDIVNDYFVTMIEILAKLSTLTGAVASNVSGYLKITSDQKIEITNNATANCLGFYTNNLISDPNTELTNVASSSLQHISGISIHHITYNVLRGYESRGNVTANFYISDDSNITTRQATVTSRIADIATRQSQISSRVSAIDTALSASTYTARWNEVIKRLNKKTGTYFKVGEKELAIIQSQNTISENTAKIAEIQTMLG
ncbi:MAG: hypothetical protein Q7R33_01935 [Nitrosarchaeum sp.]|nr:hypothetical protein [Nitrosarchaeum sp.]